MLFRHRKIYGLLLVQSCGIFIFITKILDIRRLSLVRSTSIERGLALLLIFVSCFLVLVSKCSCNNLFFQKTPEVYFQTFQKWCFFATKCEVSLGVLFGMDFHSLFSAVFLKEPFFIRKHQN